MAQGRNRKLVDDRARAWFMLRHERHLSPREEAEFQQWLAEPAHSASYRQLERICEGLRVIAATEEGERLRARHRKAREKGREREQWWMPARDFLVRTLTPAPALAMALVMVLAVGIVGFNASWNRALATDSYATGIAQTRTVTLEDGSEITLGADSRIEASLGERRRDLVLVKGQAFFTVARDPARPFYVAAGDIDVRVVGTRFEVHRAPGSVKVAVEEGIVDVRRKDSPGGPGVADGGVRLLAGQAVRMGAEGGGSVEPVILEELAGWRHGKLIYRNARLAEVVADANRYREGKIVLGAPRLAELRLTTSFSVDQVETMISMLEESLPVSVYRETGNRIVIWPRTLSN